MTLLSLSLSHSIIYHPPSSWNFLGTVIFPHPKNLSSSFNPIPPSPEYPITLAELIHLFEPQVKPTHNWNEDKPCRHHTSFLLHQFHTKPPPHPPTIALVVLQPPTSPNQFRPSQSEFGVDLHKFTFAPSHMVAPTTPPSPEMYGFFRTLRKSPSSHFTPPPHTPDNSGISSRWQNDGKRIHSDLPVYQLQIGLWGGFTVFIPHFTIYDIDVAVGG